MLNETRPRRSPPPLRTSWTNSEAASRASCIFVRPGTRPGADIDPERSMTRTTSKGVGGAGGFASSWTIVVAAV